jgi:hypothetical protein
VYRLVLFAGLYVAARSWGKIAAAGVIAIAAFVLLPLYSFANAWIMALGLALGSLSLLARSLPFACSIRHRHRGFDGWFGNPVSN